MIEQLIKYKWIYHQIFWDLLEKLVFRKEVENDKDLLKGLWFIDVDIIFTSEVDNKNFKDISKIIFKFYENLNNDKQ